MDKLKIVIKLEFTLMEMTLHLPTWVSYLWTLQNICHLGNHTDITHHLQREDSGKVPGRFQEGFRKIPEKLQECSGNIQGIVRECLENVKGRFRECLNIESFLAVLILTFAPHFSLTILPPLLGTLTSALSLLPSLYSQLYPIGY